jgi:protein-tyrosine phosphatase
MPESVESGMIDIHSHVLPGLDDGASDMDEAIRMCSIAAGDGITTIVATPHHLNGMYFNSKDRVTYAVSVLNKCLSQHNISLKVLPGSDVHLCTSLLDKLKDGSVMTINNAGKFILLELPSFFVPAHVREQVFQLKLMGITPIITHPERNNTAMEHPTLLLDLVGAGALMQVTAGSITGDFGSSAKSSALRLMDMRIVHIVSSDAHNSTSRPPRLSKAFASLSKELGEEEAKMAFSTRPASILEGAMPIISKPKAPKRRRTLLSFLGLEKRLW